MHFSTSVIVAAAAVFSSANAHMLLAQPKAFPGYSNGPLEPDGSNYPCKNANYADRSNETKMPVGSKQPLSFKGSAVHGGGSCQVAITYDLNPTKASKFMVIHSIEGGCPGQNPNAPNQNLAQSNPENTDPGSGLHSYTFTIPEGLPAGKGVLSWSWVNKIGNREFYQNCAPVEITGGSASKRDVEQRRRRNELQKRANFPSIFLANIGNGCSTTEGVDIVYPNPGESVEKGTNGMNFGPPVGNCGGDSVSSPSGDQQPPSSSSSSTPSPAKPPTGPIGTGTAPKPNPTGGIFHEPEPKPSSSSVVATPVGTGSPQPPAQPPSGSPPASNPTPPTSTGPSTGEAGAQTGACTSEGAWNCVGGTSFQRCASGQWSAVMAMSAGTACKPGQGSDFSMVVKRSVRFSDSHLAMHRMWNS